MSILTLPREALIYLDNEKIEIEIPENYKKQINIENIQKSRGIWKDKKIDPVDYQKKIRAEWD